MSLNRQLANLISNVATDTELNDALASKAPIESPTFTGTTNFSSFVNGFGQAYFAYEGYFDLQDGESAIVIQNNNGYSPSYAEIFCLSQHGSNGYLYLLTNISRYGRYDAVIQNNMAWTEVNYYQNPSNVSQNAIQFQRTGTYPYGDFVRYNVYVRAICPNRNSNLWSSPIGLTPVSSGF